MIIVPIPDTAMHRTEIAMPRHKDGEQPSTFGGLLAFISIHTSGRSGATRTLEQTALDEMASQRIPTLTTHNLERSP
jgi:hypothetical protein